MCKRIITFGLNTAHLKSKMNPRDIDWILMTIVVLLQTVYYLMMAEILAHTMTFSHPTIHHCLVLWRWGLDGGGHPYWMSKFVFCWLISILCKFNFLYPFPIYWFRCAESNLNGIYEPSGIFTNKSEGITNVGIFWKNWLGMSPLKASRMMIRPRDVWFNGNMSVEDYNQLDDV